MRTCYTRHFLILNRLYRLNFILFKKYTFVNFLISSGEVKGSNFEFFFKTSETIKSSFSGHKISKLAA